MGVPLHETEKNFTRFGLIHANMANKLGLSDAVIAALATGDAAGLDAALAALNVHETESNFKRQIRRTLTKLTTGLKTSIGKPGAPTLATANSGGSIADATTVFVVVTAIDQDGVESVAGVEATLVITGNGGNDNTLTVKSLSPVNGAASYRIYYGSVGTGAYEKGYKADAAKAVEGSTGVTVTTLSSGLTAGTPPTSSVAGVAALSVTEIAAAKAAGLFTTLRSGITNDDSSLDATLDRGAQVTT